MHPAHSDTEIYNIDRSKPTTIPSDEAYLLLNNRYISTTMTLYVQSHSIPPKIRLDNPINRPTAAPRPKFFNRERGVPESFFSGVGRLMRLNPNKYPEQRKEQLHPKSTVHIGTTKPSIPR